MSLPVALPNPSNFLGVALVMRSRDGPRWVFHYPPHLVPAASSAASRRGHAMAAAAAAAEDEWDEDDFASDQLPRETADADGYLSGGGGVAGSMPRAAELAQWNKDDHVVTESGARLVPWEHVAGFPTKDLESILTPARAYHKKLFQVSLDPLYFVSHPVYVPENGSWKKAKKAPKARSGGKGSDQVDPRDVGGGGHRSFDRGLLQASDMERKESGRGKGLAGGGDEQQPDKVANMNMFNLVFILNPKRHEAKELVSIMYAHIIRKVNKAYKYGQQQSEYVWKESKKILALKEKAREERKKMTVLWGEIVAESSLAASMKEVFDAVSQNKIAIVQLATSEGTVAQSVHIPIPFFVEDLPPEEDETSRGLWITTANSLDEDDEPPDESTLMDKNFALLLLESEKKIVAELQADADETARGMIEFVRQSRPTMSIYQVSQNSSLSLTAVRRYAQHFIFWRRAIAIPPLHLRDVYIPSPNSDATQLPAASIEWARLFPYAPALPAFLGELSGAPRPFKALCPSKAFRPHYLHMLAHLMRGGWVTQLCTFAYVVAWPEIVYEVDYKEEEDALRRAEESAARRAGGGGGSSAGFGTTGSTATVAGTLGGLGSGTASASGSGTLPPPAPTTPLRPPGHPATTLPVGAGVGPHRPRKHRQRRRFTFESEASPADEEDDAMAANRAQPPADAGRSRGGPSRDNTSYSASGEDEASSSATEGDETSTSDGGDDDDGSTSSGSSGATRRPSAGVGDVAAAPALAATATVKMSGAAAAERARLARAAERAANALLDRRRAHDRRPVPPSVARARAEAEAKAAAAAGAAAAMDSGGGGGVGGGGGGGSGAGVDDGKVGGGTASTGPGRQPTDSFSGGAATRPSTNPAPHLRPVAPHIILDAGRATGLEAMYLAAIGDRLRQVASRAAAAEAASSSSSPGAPKSSKAGVAGAPPPSEAFLTNAADATPVVVTAADRQRAADMWPDLCKYFNGRTALERVALQEDMKRKEAWVMLTALSEYLLCVRHW